MSVEVPPAANRFRTDLLSWWSANRRHFPWREPDRSRYEVFVAEFFLTQTPPENVASLYEPFLDRYPDLGALGRSGPDELAEIIRPIGFHNMRARALTEIASEYDELPGEVAALESLPRVGHYVANATLCFADERRLPIVDRNVRRVYRRVFGGAFPDREDDQVRFAGRVLPPSGRETRRYNLALLDFGAEICTKQDPACETCFAADYCHYASGGPSPN